MSVSTSRAQTVAVGAKSIAREELALIYQARGLSPDEAGVIADRLIASPGRPRW